MTGNSDTPTAIVQARSVCKSYPSAAGRTDVLRDVDLVVAHGEMVAIMGPSGCGKTTLLNCLSGLDSIDGGEVLIDGTPLSGLSMPAMRLSSVVLPEPDGPMSAVKSPPAMSSVMSESTGTIWSPRR